MIHRNSSYLHPQFSRRMALQAGGIGLLGLGMNHVEALRAADVKTTLAPKTARACIFIFLSGGLGQHDSFDMKPEAADSIRGEFNPIATRTPGLHICEHLPLLAQRSQLWSLCRSLSHPSNDHSAGHHIMLTGKTMLPPAFDPTLPKPTDWPSIAAIAGAVTSPRNNLPPAAVLPERLIHTSRRVIPGQFAGVMGAHRDPWFIEASSYSGQSYGAFPEYPFHFEPGKSWPERTYQVPDLTLPAGLTHSQFDRRMGLLHSIEKQRQDLDQAARTESFDRHRQSAISLLTGGRVKKALDVRNASPESLDRYGRNAFGWSLLMARNLVEVGVNLVQVNLGNNESWDTHEQAFPILKDKLFPPTDRALSALLDDLQSSGMLENTLVVMAGEFGRTPHLSRIRGNLSGPGRNHWGAAQTVFFAGGGIQGGRVVGATDKIGAYPSADPQKPENFAATIYTALGLPQTVAWYDAVGRPNHVFEGTPILGLM